MKECLDGLFTPDGYESRAEIMAKLANEEAKKGLVFETPLPVVKPFNEWSERFEKRAKEFKETEVRKNHVVIRFPQETLVNIIGDTHIGSPDTNYRRIYEEITSVVETTNSYLILLGDVVDGFFFNPAQMEQIEQPPEQFEYMKSMLRYLGENKKLLVGFGGDHDCLDSKTEVLTKRGWITQDMLRENDEVLSFNIKTESCIWTRFSHIIREDFSGELNRIKNSHLDILATDKHRFFYKQRSRGKYIGEYSFTPIKNLVLQNYDNREIVCAGNNLKQDFPINDVDIQLVAWLLTDGGIRGKQVTFYQSKKSRNKIVQLLNSGGYEYKTYIRNRTRIEIDQMPCGKTLPGYEFRISTNSSKKLLQFCPVKHIIPEWVFELSKRQFDLFLEALIDGDGSRKGKALMFYQHRKEIINQLQTLCVMNGYRTSIYLYSNRSGSEQYRLNILPKKTSRVFSYKKNSSKEKYVGVIWDLTVPIYHNFLVRRNGKAYFTGNSWAKKMGMSAYSSFSEETGAYYMQGLGYITAKVGNLEYKITAAHRLPGSSMYNKTHSQNRALRFGGATGSDIVIAAHCFDNKTEILTPNGWVNGLSVKTGDVVGTLNLNTGKTEWNSVNEKVEYSHFKKLYTWETKLISLAITDQHGMVYKQKGSKNFKLCSAKELTKLDRILIPATSQIRVKKPKNDLHKFLIWVVSDGSISTLFRTNNVRFHLKKERKIKRLLEILHSLSLEYHIAYESSGCCRIEVRVGNNFIKKYFPNGKILGKWLFDFDPELVFEEYGNIDGSFSLNHNSVQIATAKEKEVDLLQHFFVINGFRATKNKRVNVWTLYVNKRNVSTLYPKRDFKIVPYNGIVWCVSVNNGTLIVRRNGKVCITQNTHQKGISRQWVTEFPGVTRPVDMISVGSYKATDEYARKFGFAEQRPEEMFGCSLLLSDKVKDVTVVDDILKANKIFKESQVS
jgi:hypothetical protein